MNKTTIIWIVCIVAALLIAWLISFLVIIQLMKKAQKKAFAALDELVPYERERYEAVKKAFNQIIDERRMQKDNQMYALCTEQEKILAGDRIDMSTLKAQNDFMILYLHKFIKEKKLRMKEPFSTIDTDLDKYTFIDPSSKDSPYRSYNNVALKYNSYMGMMLVSNYASRKGYPKAPIL
ncbi:MAG: hypothetical protein WCR67_00480 [Bacilli bacterium]